jgi:hypothetical protein
MVKLSIHTTAWSNFKQWMFEEPYRGWDSLTYHRINQQLEPWGGAIKNMGQEHIDFVTESELTAFLLRWS